MKCLQCKKEIDEGYKWCSIHCKGHFYLANFAGDHYIEYLNVFYKQEVNEARTQQLYKFTKWKKDNPNKGIMDYIRGFGEFENTSIEKSTDK